MYVFFIGSIHWSNFFICTQIPGSMVLLCLVQRLLELIQSNPLNVIGKFSGFIAYAVN